MQLRHKIEGDEMAVCFDEDGAGQAISGLFDTYCSGVRIVEVGARSTICMGKRTGNRLMSVYV